MNNIYGSYVLSSFAQVYFSKHLKIITVNLLHKWLLSYKLKTYVSVKKINVQTLYNPIDWKKGATYVHRFHALKITFLNGFH